MTKPYRKPLKGGGKRIIHRQSGGQFARPTLNADICQHCLAIIVPKTVNVGTDAFPMLKKQRPTECPQCGKELSDA